LRAAAKRLTTGSISHVDFIIFSSINRFDGFAGREVTKVSGRETGMTLNRENVAIIAKEGGLKPAFLTSSKSGK
jgi:hypothetical protein